jgi:hypothetical protein
MKIKDMIRRFATILFLYILVPIIIIPYLSFKFGNLFGLFGILFYYMGLIIARFRHWIFLPIPIIFCLWYWFTYGFGIRDYVTIYFVCMMVAVLFQQIDTEINKLIFKILPEQEQNLDYDNKIEEMNQQIALYKKEHPSEKITQEVIEKIRTEIFFN